MQATTKVINQTGDFAASLSYIRDSLAKADLVIGNLEGVCAGEAAGYGRSRRD